MNDRMDRYLNSVRDKRIAVVGIGVSNTPLLRTLLRAGCSVTACDMNEDLGGLKEELESLGAELRLGPGYLDGLDHDLVFRTPGMMPTMPELVEARARGSVITSEMEAFFEVCPCRTIAVTGSDGKTTTSTIIAELLRREGYNVYLGGNIGKPLFAEAAGMQPEDVAVLELSSFQLMTMQKSPDIAVVTNVTQNHLDKHSSMEEYIEAKRNIYLHQGPDGVLICNLDNTVSAGFGATAPGRLISFTMVGEPENGLFFSDGMICSAEDGRIEQIVSAQEIRIPGEHNVQNYMAAFAAVRGMVSADNCRVVAREFAGVEHRIELVRRHRGIAYYNDSIASSPTRTIAGLRSFEQKVILIAGGYDKHIAFDELGGEICARVRTLVLTGDTAELIRKAVEGAGGYKQGAPEIIYEPGFNDAVRAAVNAAAEGDIVLLSPACASFDSFKNFMERGEAFKAIIRALD